MFSAHICDDGKIEKRTFGEKSINTNYIIVINYAMILCFLYNILFFADFNTVQ